MRRLLMAILLLSCAGVVHAQESGSVVIDGSVYDYRYTPIDRSYTPSEGGGSGRSFLSPIPVGRDGYISFMIAPAYTAETSLLLGVAVNYDKYGNDASSVANVGTKRCSVSLSGRVSITGFYGVVLKGCNVVDKSGSQRLAYGLEVRSEPSRIWGVDYDSALIAPRHRYTDKEYSAWLRYSLSLRRFTLGLYGDYRYLDAVNLDAGAAQILYDEQHDVSTAGVGVSVAYDSRKSPLYERGVYSGGVRGVYVMAEAVYRPKVLSNMTNDILQLRAVIDCYQPLWRGGLMALDIYGETSSSGTPWLLLPQLGSDSRMRGYYAGRFRGNYLASAQVELRQHVWNGIGVVAWGGAGVVLSRGERFHWRRLLPTYGAGLRYGYEQLTVRFDVAFGCDGPAFILGLSEAF